jgi:hypothetical protein
MPTRADAPQLHLYRLEVKRAVVRKGTISDMYAIAKDKDDAYDLAIEHIDEWIAKEEYEEHEEDDEATVKIWKDRNNITIRRVPVVRGSRHVLVTEEEPY